MIYYVKGNFVEKTATNVIVDCAGISYDVQISLILMQISNHWLKVCSSPIIWFVRMPKCSSIYYKTRKALFELLISVSGVGAGGKSHFEFTCSC